MKISCIKFEYTSLVSLIHNLLLYANVKENYQEEYNQDYKTTAMATQSHGNYDAAGNYTVT